MLALNQTKSLIQRLKKIEHARRSLQVLSGDILSGSKRAIFAFHRDDQTVAMQELQTAQKKLRLATRLTVQESRIRYDGPWRAAQEEFAEAHLLSQYLRSGKIGPVPDVSDDPDIFIGALSDLTGELVRHAVRLVTQHKKKSVTQIFQDVDTVVGFLLQMDLTGNLRTKVDQAKQNLRKLEEMCYELALRS
ncbi:hypothetical protein EXS71_02880 [Candidatus Uhrbacteria bacterium]|nr:hypothetical protein [Candidatus Uhrbacteria bacterium]